MARYRMAPHAGRLLCPPDRCWTNSKATAAFSLLFSRRQNCKSQYVSENTRVSRKDKDQSQQGQTAASQPGRPAALAPGVARAVAGGRPTAATGGWGGGGDEAGGASSAALGSAHTAGTLPREGGTCCCGARQRCGFVGIKALFGADSIPPTAALLCAVSESSKQLWKQHLGQSLPCAPSQAPPCCCPSRGAPKQPSRPPRITSAQWVSPQFSLRANLGVLGGFVLHFRFFS